MHIANGKTHVRRVDFFVNSTDFQCVMLAAIGLSTVAISRQTGLTEGQVMYRIMKAEGNRQERRGKPTSRLQYRNGDGDIAKRMISAMAANRDPAVSNIRKVVVGKLNTKGLYVPRARGVLRNAS